MSFELNIWGICLLITFPNSFLLQFHEQAYQHFLERVTSSSLRQKAISMNIDLQCRILPSIKGLKPIFENDQSWVMFENEGRLVIALKSPAYKDPFWIASVSADFTKISIHCHEDFVSYRNDKVVLQNPVSYPLDQILLMHILALRQGAIVHAAGMVLDGRAFIFPGKSGAGKSTICRLLAARDEIELLSDDRMIVRKMDGTFRAYGTPWPGEAGIAVNASAPLAGIFFLSHGTSNQIREIAVKDALNRLLPTMSIPWYDRGIVAQMLQLCEDLISTVPMYDLVFTPSHEVMDVITEFIST